MSRGFSVIELLAVLGVLALLSAIAVPRFSEMSAQMSASEDVRAVASILRELRSEAVRLRSPVDVTLSAGRLSWDLDDDDAVDGSYSLNKTSEWEAASPPSLSFSGMGLLGGGETSIELRIRNRGASIGLTVNANGHIELES